jgi:hypothetical protein
MKKVCLSRRGEVDLYEKEVVPIGCLYPGKAGSVVREWSTNDGTRLVDVEANGHETTYAAEYVREA